MIPLSMTLSDLWHGFQSHDIFLRSNFVKTARFKDKVTITHEETIPSIWNSTMFGDLDWPLNASRGFVSISWASCWQIFLKTISVCVWFMRHRLDWKITIAVEELGHDFRRYQWYRRQMYVYKIYSRISHAYSLELTNFLSMFCSIFLA